MDGFHFSSIEYLGRTSPNEGNGADTTSDVDWNAVIEVLRGLRTTVDEYSKESGHGKDRDM